MNNNRNEENDFALAPFFLPPYAPTMNQAGGPPAGGAPPPFRPQVSTAVQYSCAGTPFPKFDASSPES